MVESTQVSEEHERKLREQISTLDGHKSHALASVYSAMWLQHLSTTATLQEYATMVKHGDSTILEATETVETAFDAMFDQKTIRRDEIRTVLLPLLDFVSTYPDANKIAGAEYLFSSHPEIKDAWGITTKGLELMNDLIRPFFIRENQIEKYRWESACPDPPYSSVPTEEFVARFLSFSVENASCASTDEYLAGVRSRFIARSMKKRALYAWKNKSYVKTKDFYLCMREVEPDRINGIHHIGSTPVLVALENAEENKTLKQIISLTILASFLDALYVDDTFGDPSPPRSQLRKLKTREAFGFFCGRYVVVNSTGTLTETGTDWDGVKGCVLLYTSRHAPHLHDYLSGARETYRNITVEDEHASSTCF